MTNCISIDWLQLRVSLPYLQYHLHKSSVFDIVREDKGTQQFKALYKIINKENKEEVAWLVAEPRSEMCMKENEGIIKILNKYLYQKKFLNFVQFILKELELTFLNITMYHIAMDFERFDDMEVPDFINGIADRNYLKTIKNKFKLNGETWSVDKGQLTGGYETLSFGLASSDVSYTLYNKTLEMAQKSHKGWIADHWRSKGWNGTTTVWRLEFKLKCDTRGIVLDTGEILDFKSLSMLDKQIPLYKHCFSKYFNFVYTEKTKKGNYKKQSRCMPVVLFKALHMEPVTIDLSNKKDAGRSSKIFAKNLLKLNAELRGQDWDMAIMGNEIMTWIIKTRDLDAWAKKKFPDIQLSERILEMVVKGQASKLQSMANDWSNSPKIFDKAGKSI